VRRPRRLIVKSTRDGLDDLFARLKHGPLAVDTETTDLPWWDGKTLVGSINLAAGETSAFLYKNALAPAARYLSDEVKEGRELVFHDAKFDLHHLRESFGLHVPYPVHDTKVMSFLLDNRGVWAYGHRGDKPHSLKPLASIFVDPEAKDPERELLAAIRAAGGRDKGDWLLAPEQLFGPYGALDPWYTLQLFLQFRERIRHWAQPSARVPSLWSLYELERWMILALRDMEERGILADREFLERWRRRKLEPKKLELERRLAKLAGREINWNSADQLSQLLYNRKPRGLGLVPERMTDGGRKKIPKPSTDTVALLNLAHPIGPIMVQYRETFKQWSSYTISLVNAIAPDGAIHPTFKSTGTEPGRTSCVNPNLQQQTRVSGVRKAYHPRPGLVFRMADYMQIEMRLAAHFGREPSLLRGFLSDPTFDPHGATALKMFGRLYDPKSQHRKFAKILNFTTIFGGGVQKISEQLIDLMEEDEAIAGCREFGIRKLPPGLTPWRALAGELKARYKAEMPNLMRALRDDADLAEQRGYAMHDFGGHRFFDDRWYRAFNTRIQGTAGVQAKRGLVNVYRECQLNRGELALLLIIHDEIFYESEGDPRTDRRVLELMKETKRFRIPIVAEISGSAKNWQSKVKIKL
jgi:DNA polymerase-1